MRHFRHILTVLAVCLLNMGYSQIARDKVYTTDALEEVRACQGDEQLNFRVINTFLGPGEVTYVITKDNGDILGISSSDMIMTAGAPVGVCRVYGFYFLGAIVDSMVTNVEDLESDDSFALSDNWVTVYRDSVSAGTLNIIGGTDEVTADAGDPALDFSVETTADIAEQKYAYIITKDNGDILGFPPSNMAAISGAPVGICRVYGFAYTGDIVDSTVVNISELTADGCFELSQNWITANRNAPEVDGARVYTTDSEESVRACQGDDALNFDLMTSSEATGSYAYIVTNDDGDILGFPPANSVMIAGAPVGVCRVYGISFTGLLDMDATTISTLTSDGDFDLSENWVTVYRDSVSAGTLNIIGGTDEVTADAGDPALDFSVETTADIAEQKYAYIITKDNGDILGFPPSNMAAISGAPVGICRVYGFAYTGDIVDSTVVNISELTADGCFELSQNWITANRNAPEVDGARVYTTDSEESVRACQGDDALNFDLMTSSEATGSYAYIVTNDDGDILGFPPANSVMIAGAPVGVCRVYGISFTGLLDMDATTISTLTSDGDFDLSENWVTVYRDSVSAGTLNIIGGTDEVTADAGDPALDFSVETTADIAEQKYAYIITKDNGDILGFPPSNMAAISGAPVGICRVYGFAYTGDIVDSTVVNISELTADGCFELSQNWITANRNAPEVDGARVYTTDSEESVRACQGDDALNFDLMTSSEATGSYAYIVTNDDGDILGFPPANSVMIAGAPVGVCRVYGISFTGLLDMDATTISTLTSDGDFDLSENWVTVYRDSVSAGTLNIIGGTDEVTADAGDPALDFSVETTADIAEQKYAYIITKDNGDILGFPPSNMAAISGAPVGICRVYGFAYTGDIVDSTVVNISELTADGCFELSQNWITANRNEIVSIEQLRSIVRDKYTINKNILSVDKSVIDYSIYSAQGKALISANSTEQNVSDLKQGVYIIKLNTEEGLFSSRFFKQ